MVDTRPVQPLLIDGALSALRRITEDAGSKLLGVRASDRPVDALLPRLIGLFNPHVNPEPRSRLRAIEVIDIYNNINVTNYDF